ncbi:hypothetical protein MAR_023584 [Mya arenaria]|uniref:Uncharacterized protein n=2 Tax=Mya arenaria TaxID=6604 RepID=A0ABY7DNC8_MYAAR|nr:uncharacterized protein LOC128226519 isoform X2 [Mya arenaria]XP_052792396.1 uncharacterized protein LOC128226519 isoform X2 [Mya arenaria]WAQ99211.1 hypothetical protein MAR_023584 [Mya arenaria]
MSDNNQTAHGHLSIIEADNVPSIPYNRQEETMGGRHAFVTSLTEFERPTERHVVSFDTENSLASNGLLVNENGNAYQPDIREGHAELESSPFGSPISSKFEALAISTSANEYRRERHADAVAYPPNSRDYNETFNRNAPATSFTGVEQSRLLQPKRKHCPSQDQNLEVSGGATGEYNSQPRNRFQVNIKHPKYKAYKKRLKSFEGHARSWPHQKPTSAEMAQANFIFRGSDRYHDAVECFLCGKTFRQIQETDVLDKLCDCNLELNRAV